MIRYFGSLVLVLLAAGCSSPVGPGALAELEQARSRWSSRGFTDYTFETRRDCFCPPEQTGPVRVTVVDDTVATVTDLATDSLTPVTDPGSWYTVDDLFAVIDSAVNNALLERVEVDYDPDLGYPRVLELTSRPDVTDANIRYTITLLTPLP